MAFDATSELDETNDGSGTDIELYIFFGASLPDNACVGLSGGDLDGFRKSRRMKLGVDCRIIRAAGRAALVGSDSTRVQL